MDVLCLISLSGFTERVINPCLPPCSAVAVAGLSVAACAVVCAKSLCLLLLSLSTMHGAFLAHPCTLHTGS